MSRTITTQVKVPKSSFLIIFWIIIAELFVESGSTVQNTLKCYQCEVNAGESSASTCNSTHLQTCPSDRAYDRCVVNILKNETTGQIKTVKGCVLGPCHFKSREVDTVLGFDKCDLSKRHLDCVICCSTDGCNENLEKKLLSNSNRHFEHSFYILVGIVTLGLIFNF